MSPFSFLFFIFWIFFVVSIDRDFCLSCLNFSSVLENNLLQAETYKEIMWFGSVCTKINQILGFRTPIYIYIYFLFPPVDSKFTEPYLFYQILSKDNYLHSIDDLNSSV